MKSKIQLLKAAGLVLGSLILFSSFTTFGQAPAWQWAAGAGGTGYDWSNHIAVDTNGNSFSIGWFYSPYITVGSDTLLNADSSGNSTDIFIVKYDASGNVLWAKSAGGMSIEGGSGITTDLSGNAYITGSFLSSAVTFGSWTITNSGGYDMFLAKLDTYGNVLWAKSAAGSSNDDGQSVTTDAAGNLYLAGNFRSPAFTLDTITLINPGGANSPYDIYIARYDTSGTIVWAKSAGGTIGERIAGIAADANGNVYIVGDFESPNIGFDTIVLTNTGQQDIFIAKYDTSGNVLWAKSAAANGYASCSAIAADVNGNTCITGSLYSTSITFDSITLTNSGGAATYVAKYNPSGNIIWAESTSSTDIDYGTGICADGNGNFYITGAFRNTITFGSTTLISPGGFDIFVAKYDSSGNVLWGKRAGNGKQDYGWSIVADEFGMLYITGTFSSQTINFGGTILTNSAPNSMETFVAKLDNVTGFDEEINFHQTLNIYPNPVTNNFTIAFPNTVNKGAIEIYTILGKKIFKENITNISQKEIHLKHIPGGIYFVKVWNGEKYFSNKIIIQQN
ncbi:MAG TPA: T9SS type A sorting domain-containing protein [Bacteroidia bacterium]|nr:T9SS type A sorting domain-containing protein [Bacteroidia bacterium]